MLGWLVGLYPSATAYVPSLEQACARFQIMDAEQAAHWLAQLAHESQQFKRTTENLNYSAAALTRTWPTRFADGRLAYECAHHPELIANLAYADRLGNGDRDSGDGWRYRGRGLVQITGRANYHECSMGLYGDDRLIGTPDLLEDPNGAAMSAGWYWRSRELDRLVPDVQAITKRINGGLHGLDDRVVQLNRIKAALASSRPVGGA